jgi:hypothetical protein
MRYELFSKLTGRAAGELMGLPMTWPSREDAERYVADFEEIGGHPAGSLGVRPVGDPAGVLVRVHPGPD